MSVIEKLIAIVMITRKILQLVIIVVFTTAFAKVIRNCNDYIYIGNHMDLSAIWEYLHEKQVK